MKESTPSDNKSSKKLELKDFEQFDRKAEKQQKKHKLNKQSDSYLDYGLEDDEDLEKYKRYFK